jgi:hypothetical protein
MTNEIQKLGNNVRAFLDGFYGPIGRNGDGDKGDDARGTQFPPGGIDFIRHDLRIMMTGEKGDYQEVVNMTGAMMIQRTDPSIGKEGRRQIEFKVLSWAATGWSEKLNVAISYVLSEDVDQPVSTIVAEGNEFDFPASFNFNVIFDTRINNETVFRQLHGRPEGHGFLTVPPVGDRKLSPTITRFTDIGKVSISHPVLGKIVAKPVDCNDRQGETLLELPGVPLIGPLGLAPGSGSNKGGGRKKPGSKRK